MKSKLYKIAMAATFGLSLAFALSCSGDEGGNPSSSSGDDVSNPSSSSGDDVSNPSSSSEGGNAQGSCPNASTTPVNYEEDIVGSVTCGGKVYKTVNIGDQVWMAENLNYNAIGSKCGNGTKLSDANTSTCDTYGRLYNWHMAMAACPAGWHLPSTEEWQELVDWVDGNAYRLKASDVWNNSAKGTDNYGFAALPGGNGFLEDDYFTGAGEYGHWWSATSATEYSDNTAWSRSIDFRGGVYRDYDVKMNRLFSVRCVQD
jgi:uncharacterized protein (TIGR02145 family)